MSINIRTSFQTDNISEMVNPANVKTVDMAVAPLKEEDIVEEIPISIMNVSQTSLIRENDKYLSNVTDRQQTILFRDMRKTKLCHEFQDKAVDNYIYLFYGVTLDRNGHVTYAYIVADYATSMVKIYPITKKYWDELNENYSYLDIALQFATTNLSERFATYDAIFTDRLVNLTILYDEDKEKCGSDIISCIILSKVDTNKCYKNMKYNITLPILSNFLNVYPRYVIEDKGGYVFNIESQPVSDLCNIYLNNNIAYNFRFISNDRSYMTKLVNTGLIPEVYNCSSFAKQLTEMTSFLRYNSDMLVSLLHYYFGENYFVAKMD